MRLLADDLFAGAGGWDVAADWLDIHARGVENMPAARATRDAAGLTTQHDDVWTFKPRYLLARDRVRLIAAGLIASPPCQPFSTAGKGAGRKALTKVLQLIPHVQDYSLKQLRRIATRASGDERTALVLAPLWFALHHPYRWLAWEQVPSVLPVWQACAVVLRAHGFHVWTGVLNAEQYGVPQTRKRAVLIASRDHEVTPPTPTHSRYYSHDPARLDAGVAKWVSMAEALGWPTDTRVVSNYGSGGDPANRGVRTADQPAATVTSKVDRNAVYLGGNGAGHTGLSPRPADAPFATITGAGNAVVYRASNAAKAAVRPADQPAPTVMFGAASNDVRWYPEGETTRGVPELAATRSVESRRVTVSEAGVLQTFPADFPWQGRQGKQYLQAGNAVPPLLAMAVLCAALGEPYVPPANTPASVPAQPALAIR
jgi:DNA (cytosine-5)-methyltransferase 1